MFILNVIMWFALHHGMIQTWRCLSWKSLKYFNTSLCSLATQCRRPLWLQRVWAFLHTSQCVFSSAVYIHLLSPASFCFECDLAYDHISQVENTTQRLLATYGLPYKYTFQLDFPVLLNDWQQTKNILLCFGLLYLECKHSLIKNWKTFYWANASVYFHESTVFLSPFLRTFYYPPHVHCYYNCWFSMIGVFDVTTTVLGKHRKLSPLRILNNKMVWVLISPLLTP